ncbi:orotidine-5'-phosphate decarboxylase [Vagococcus sp. JNUCC 83]
MREKRPVIALDLPSKKAIELFLANFPKEESLYVKVGMELFYQEGPSIVTWLISMGHDVFLDLKLHDIPNTVYSAMKGLAKLGVSLTNVHAAGGKEMMEAAYKGLKEGTSNGQSVPKLIAVTQLTSTSDEQVKEEQLISVGLNQSVRHYAVLTQQSGLDGVVCSAHEAKDIKTHTSQDFVCLTPGIRLASDEVGDQKRVMTPSKARENGATYIVVGRPITQAENPYDAYLEIKKQWNGEIN